VIKTALKKNYTLAQLQTYLVTGTCVFYGMTGFVHLFRTPTHNDNYDENNYKT